MLISNRSLKQQTLQFEHWGKFPNTCTENKKIIVSNYCALVTYLLQLSLLINTLAHDCVLSLFCRGDLFYRGGCREEPINQLDRVITIQSQLPPEQLTLDENTMLSSLEEGALSKCSKAEHLISAKAYSCLKQIMTEVCGTKLVRLCLHQLVFDTLNQPSWTST